MCPRNWLLILTRVCVLHRCLLSTADGCIPMTLQCPVGGSTVCGAVFVQVQLPCASVSLVVAHCSVAPEREVTAMLYVDIYAYVHYSNRHRLLLWRGE